jgi:hypothetical protein
MLLKVVMFGIIIDETDGEFEIENVILSIEVKGHDAKSSKFEGVSAFVRYSRNNSSGWHSASDQSLSQAHSLKQYLYNEFHSNIYIANLIYFENLEEHQLPQRPHNIFSSSISPRDFLTVIAENTKPWRRKNGLAVISACNEEVCKKIDNSKLFKVLIPSSLDRKKLDAISLKQGFNENWVKEIGLKITLLKGRAGTGKTIALLQIANYLFVNKSSRILILTYNLALVSDIKRILALLGLPVGLDDGGVFIESSMSFFRKLLISFCLLDEEVDFVINYKKLLYELSNALNLGVFNKAEIQNVISHFPDFFAYDFVFIDESQDWFYDEIQIIRSIYDYKNLVIADGLDQVVRGSRRSWIVGLKDSDCSIYVLDKSLRMKGNLTLFANLLAQDLGQSNWSIKSNQILRGGQVYVYVGDLLSSLTHVDKIISDAISLGNQPYDLLLLLSPEIVNLLRDEIFFETFQNLIGYKLFEGYKSDVRKNTKIDINYLRAFQYDSARGLEGWVTFCLGFDLFYLHRLELANRTFDNLEDEVLSRDEWIERDVNGWLLMVLTRSIDSTFIHISDTNSIIARKIKNIVKLNPDIFIWLEENDGT